MTTLTALPSMLRERAVMDATGLARSTVWWYAKNGLLPSPIKIGERCVAWDASEIAAIMAARRRGADNEQVRQLVKQLEAARAHAA